MSNWAPADWWLFAVGILGGIPIALGVVSLVRNLVGYLRYRKRAEQFNQQVEQERREREKLNQVLRDLELEEIARGEDEGAMKENCTVCGEPRPCSCSGV